MKKPTFQIVSDPHAEASGADMIICFRVKDLPIPYVAAKIMVCTGCGERCWFSNTSPRGIPIKCHHCAADVIAARADEEELVFITRKQVAEASAYLLAMKMKKKRDPR